MGTGVVGAGRVEVRVKAKAVWMLLLAVGMVGLLLGLVGCQDLAQVPHTVSTPGRPSGPSSGEVGQSLTYSTGGASCSDGHSVQYWFDWGDGTYSSWSSSTTASKSWSSPGTYQVRAQARCSSDSSVVSSWSPSRTVTITAPAHTVSTPSRPLGPSSDDVGQLLEYSSGGASCSQGHPVEYRFDWGDGTYSSWSSSTSASKAWDSAGTFQVKAQARCARDPAVVSSWSGSLIVTIEAGHSWISPIGAVASGYTRWGNTWYTGPPEFAIDNNPITAWTLNDMGEIIFDLGSTRTIKGIEAYWRGSVSNGNTVNVFVDNTQVLFHEIFEPTSNKRYFDGIQGRYVKYQTVPLPHNEYGQIATWSEIAEFKVLIESE